MIDRSFHPVEDAPARPQTTAEQVTRLVAIFPLQQPLKKHDSHDGYQQGKCPKNTIPEKADGFIDVAERWKAPTTFRAIEKAAGILSSQALCRFVASNNYSATTLLSTATAERVEKRLGKNVRLKLPP